MATGEHEKIEYSGDGNPVMIYTGIDGTQYRTYQIKTPGPVFDNVSSREIKKVGGDWVATDYYSYDIATGRLIRRTDAYDNDKVFSYTNHTGASPFAPPATEVATDATGRSWTYTYDIRGNLTSVEDGAGVSRTYEYDSRDRRIKVKNDAGTVVAQYAYNNNNRLTSYKDADSNETTFEYLNRYGRSWLTKITTPTSITAEFTYDSRGNCTSVKDLNGETWTLTPSTNNLLEKITDPLTHETQFDYDSRNNLNSVENALHDTISLEYDDLDRMKKITDALTYDSTYRHNAEGRM